MFTHRIGATGCHRSALVVALVLAAGACVSCDEMTQTRTSGVGDRYRPYQSPEAQAGASVNTGLASLSGESHPPTLIEGEQPDAEPLPQADRVAESARLLDEYFGKLSQGRGAETTLASRTTEPARSGGYDPSAELGPTGSSRYVSIDTTPDDHEFEGGLANLGGDEPTDPSGDPVLSAIHTPTTSAPMAAAQTSTQTPAQTPARTPIASAAPGGIRIEDAPAMPSGQSPTGSGQMGVRIVERPTTTPTTTVPTTGPTAGQITGVPTSTHDDPALASIENELNSAPTGRLTGVPVDSGDGSVAVASADSQLTKIPASPEQRKQQLVDELVSVLNELAVTGDEPYRAGLALAGLETLSPGALYQLTESGVLMPDEVRTLLAAHELFSGMSADGGTADAGRVSDLLRDVKEKLDEHAPLMIPAAELCTRVLGYGQYDMFPKGADGSYTFQAGRRQPIIIYTEVDRFGRRPLVGADGLPRWEVTLSQELQIYHETDDLLVMARQAETDRSVSRNKIRDYYLINQTYLPETLGVGRYNLKVIMRDENKQAVSERIIPITIVPAGALPTKN